MSYLRMTCIKSDMTDSFKELRVPMKPVKPFVNIVLSPKVPSHSSLVGNPHIQGNHYILTSTIERFPLSLLYTPELLQCSDSGFFSHIMFLRFTHNIANHWWLFSLLHNIALGNYTAITHSSVAGKLTTLLFGVCSSQNNGSLKDAHILIPENVLP